MKQDAKKDRMLPPCQAGDTRAHRRHKAKAASQNNSNRLIENYQRQRDLPHLLALWPQEINDVSATGTRKLIAKLRCALRAERQRGHAGHWSYDLDRHLELVKAYKCEVAALENRTVTRKI